MPQMMFVRRCDIALPESALEGPTRQLTPKSHLGRGTHNRLICRASTTSFVDRHRAQSRRSVRLRPRRVVAQRDDRWPRLSRYIRRSGVRRTPPTVVCWPRRTVHSVPAVGMLALRGSACSLVGTSAVTRCRPHDVLALPVSRRFRSSSILARSDQISVLSGCSAPRSRVQDPAA
jgi:hypothetical protein